jgi:hypothetical protein
VADQRRRVLLVGLEALVAQHLAADQEDGAVRELDRAIDLAEDAVERVERDHAGRLADRLEAGVGAGEEAILLDRDVGADAAEHDEVAGQRVALAVGAVAVDRHRHAPGGGRGRRRGGERGGRRRRDRGHPRARGVDRGRGERAAERVDLRGPTDDGGHGPPPVEIRKPHCWQNAKPGWTGAAAQAP